MASSLTRRGLLLLTPAVAFGGLAAAFALALSRGRVAVPSVLIGSPVPSFSLPPVEGRTLGLSTDDLHGQVSLVNVFASWCAPCRLEHPLLVALGRDGVVPIHGLNHRDEPANASRWLNRLGDPYTRTGADRDGRVAIDWGVYGIPETFVVGRNGTILYRHVGPLSEDSLRRTILPLVASAMG